MFIISIASALLPLLPIAFALRQYALLDRGLKLILWYLLTGMFSDAVGFSLRQLSWPFRWSIHIYTLAEFTLLSVAFILWLPSEKPGRAIKIVLAAYFVLWVAAKITIESFNHVDSYTASLSSFLLTTISGFMMFRLIATVRKTPVYFEYRFWIVIGTLVYCSGTALLFALGNILLKMPESEGFSTFPLYSILNITKLLCFTGAFLCLSRHPKYGGHSSSQS